MCLTDFAHFKAEDFLSSMVQSLHVKLRDGASQGFEAHKDPRLVGRSLGDVVDVGLPTEITCDFHTQESRLVNYLQGFTIWKDQLREEAIIFAWVKWENLGFLDIYLHLVGICEGKENG